MPSYCSCTPWSGESHPRFSSSVLVGNRGRRLEHFLLGSTAERVVQRANLPVLVVPVGAEGQEPATPAMAITGASLDEQC